MFWYSEDMRCTHHSPIILKQDFPNNLVRYFKVCRNCHKFICETDETEYLVDQKLRSSI